MRLGPFSLSLAVQDLDASVAFYQHLGFDLVQDERQDHWCVLSDGDAMIGLFQGRFDHNVLTFNPPRLKHLHDHLKETVAVGEITGDHDRSQFTVADPDGNLILFHGELADEA